jgi:large subunit ribosomal protein L3
MASESMGIIGKKIGMTQIFDAEGNVIPVTVVECGPNTVVQVKTADGADGYNAVQLGFGTRKASRITKALSGHLAKVGASGLRSLREFRVPADIAAKYTPGQNIGPADVFAEGAIADVTADSKGRGFSGVMKRHNFAGFERSHGVHEYFRHGGSIGTRLTPGHVQKGKKMPGRMGGKRVTVQNIQIVRVDAERNLVFLKGGVPGANGGLVLVKQAVKSLKK